MARIKEEQLNDKLSELYRLTEKAIKKKDSGDQTIETINKIYEKQKIEARSSAQSRNKLHALYTQAMTDSEVEQEALKKALAMVADVRQLKSSISRYSAPTIVRRGVLMSLLQDAAKILPLWTGEPGTDAPPLCGAQPPEPNYTCQPGDKIAALVKEEEEENWILAEVLKFNASTGKYFVADVDAEEGRERHYLGKNSVIPLPQWKANPETNPEAIFKKGTLVLALYPQTTCFYRALVDESPKTIHEGYSLFFEDPSYPEGIAPSLAVPQRYVIPLKEL